MLSHDVDVVEVCGIFFIDLSVRAASCRRGDHRFQNFLGEHNPVKFLLSKVTDALIGISIRDADVDAVR